jgi:manganese efflux pump family protein
LIHRPDSGFLLKHLFIQNKTGNEPVLIYCREIMGIFEIFMLAIGLSMDAMAVCLGAGTSPFLRSNRASVRIAFHFGLFQCLMPIAGWYLGVQVEPLISAVDHWIAFAMLGFVGGKMIHTGTHEQTASYQSNPSRGWNLVILSIATSIDALAVGFSLGMLRISIWYPSVLIGIVTGLLSFSGVKMGNRLGVKFGKKIEIIGGLLLILIGLRILITHLLAQ